MKALHQYIERATGEVRTERLYQDRALRFLYDHAREFMPVLFRLLISARSSRLLGFVNYDSRLGSHACRRFLQAHALPEEECLEDPARFTTLRELFERKIRYWQYRPMPVDPRVIVSPCDARVLLGSFSEDSRLFLKGKLFNYEELLGADRPRWLATFRDGDFAVFRLTPEKYHYNHAPVSGRVDDIYEIGGDYHSCNPGAVVRVVTPYSKNRRVVTVIDTDVDGGSRVGRVAMIEIVALMIGDIEQRYSRIRYDAPRPVEPGLFVERGCPKSVFRPGSSTTVLIFERGRVRFEPDLLRNQTRADAHSRYSLPFGRTLIETDVALRSPLARAVDAVSNGGK